jgi:signal transduction histidine kinase
VILVVAILGILASLSWALRLRRHFDTRLKQQALKGDRLQCQSRDVLLQGFQGVIYRIQAAKDLLPDSPQAALVALDAGLENADSLITSARCPVVAGGGSYLGDGDFGRSLTQLGQELLTSVDGQGVRLSLIVEGQSRSLKSSLRDDVYRIAREALRNAFRHSRSTAIESEIRYGQAGFSLRIRDNGIGLGLKQVSRVRRAHAGLPGMRHHAEAAGGTLAVWSEYGAGTEIDLNIPADLAYEQRKPASRPWIFCKPKNDQGS